MLAVAERESSFRPLPSPSPSPSYEMPLRHLAKDPAKGGEKHVVSKTPFQNSINHQQRQPPLESRTPLPVAANTTINLGCSDSFLPTQRVSVKKFCNVWVEALASASPSQPRSTPNSVLPLPSRSPPNSIRSPSALPTRSALDLPDPPELRSYSALPISLCPELRSRSALLISFCQDLSDPKNFALSLPSRSRSALDLPDPSLCPRPPRSRSPLCPPDLRSALPPPRSPLCPTVCARSSRSPCCCRPLLPTSPSSTWIPATFAAPPPSLQAIITRVSSILLKIMV